MKKARIFAIFLAVILFSLTGCEIPAVLPEQVTATAEETAVSAPLTETTTTTIEITEPETEAPVTTVPEITVTETIPETPAATTEVTTTTVVTETLPETTETVTETSPEITEISETAPETTVPETLVLETAVTTTAPPETSKPVIAPLASNYIYDRLPDWQKEVYDKILAAAEAGENKVYFDTPVPLEKLVDIYHAVLWEEPAAQYFDSSAFHYSGNPVTMMQITFRCSKAQSDQMNRAVEQRVEEIVSKITPDMSGFDIVKYFHDTIVKNCTYDLTTEYCDTAYGALVEGRALCQGYSYAFAELCDRAGIENTFVTGYAGEEHMWNMVKLGGSWYHIDLTWNDPQMSDGKAYVTYDYFCVSDKDISGRTIHPGLVEYPKASSSAENFFVRNGLYATSYEQAKNIIYNEFIKRASMGEDYVYIRLATPELYQETRKKLFDYQGIYSIQQQALMKSSQDFDAGKTAFLLNDEMNTIVLQICR